MDAAQRPMELQRVLHAGKGVVMSTAYVDRNLFGLVITAPTDHPAVALLNRLPRSLCLRPRSSTGEYIVGLTAEILSPMRRLYRMENVEFSMAAVEALAGLGKQQRRAPQRQAIEVTPDVSPALRKLDCSTDPFVSGATGDVPRLITTARSVEDSV
jgi:hypothetical protein